MVDSRKNSMEDGRKTNNAPGIRKSDILVKPLDLDHLLINELGQFGRFQLQNILLVSIPSLMSGFLNEYIFSAAAIPHRCQVPECGENSKDAEFKPKWLSNAIPTSSGFKSCERYNPLGVNGSLDYCPVTFFDQSSTVECNGFVYERTNSVVYDYDLGCQEWLRTLAGTLNSVGFLLALIYIGGISDRFGRRIALCYSTFSLALFGLIIAFSVNYPMYLALQLLHMTLAAGTFSSAYIFATELVGPKFRGLAGAFCSSMFSVGEVVLGSVAWLVQPWRYRVMVLYIPCFLIISYYWILSENVRWLLSKRRYDHARQVLEKVARVNKKQISEKSLNALLNPPQHAGTQETRVKPELLKTIIKSPVLLRRVCTTPIWWITATFVYYGLSINSTGLSGNMYLNYILTCGVEIPGFFLSVLVLDRIGRKLSLASGYIFSASCNVAFAFLSENLVTLRLVLFLLSKFGISMVFTSLYLFTAELYPTEYRHTLLSFSSMVGRIGSIVAPLTPALADYFKPAPSLMFAVMDYIAGILVLTQPETLGTKMPDTLAEAETLGKKS